MTEQSQTPLTWPPRIVVCVGAVVLRRNTALFVRQAKGASLEGQWSIPWGLVETGESPEVTALRETREEGGIIAEVKGLLGIQNFRWESAMGIIFLCHHTSGEPVPDGGVETDRAAYFTLEEIESFKEPFDPWCEWIVKRVLRGTYHLIPEELNNPYKPKMAFL